MKKFSKVLSLLLAVLMMLTMIPITASAADTYTVKYNSNGGKGSMSTTTFTVGEAGELRANAFTKTGYEFMGWATSKTATEPEYYNGQSVSFDVASGTTVTLYAVWSTNTYYVEFRDNGGKGEMANQAIKYGESTALTPNAFTREGYTFLGWSKTATATSATYADQGTVRNLTPNNGAVIVLYAIWEKNPVTVTSIFVSANPTKVEYFVDDTFDAAGLAIGVNLSDNTVQTITSGFEVSAPDMTTVGEKTVTVTYEGQTATFTILVKEANYDFTFTLEAAEKVNLGETVSVAAKLEGAYPTGTAIDWAADNDNFLPTGLENNVLTAVAAKAGTTVVTATLYDAKGNELAKASVSITAVDPSAEPEVPEEPEDPTDPVEPEDPADPEEPAGEMDIMAIIMSLVTMIMGYIQPIIDMVMGLVGQLG